MTKKIQSVPINRDGDLLFLKEFEQTEKGFFIKYRAMINDIHFQRTEIYPIDSNNFFVITGGDGTIIYRIPSFFIHNLIN